MAPILFRGGKRVDSGKISVQPSSSKSVSPLTAPPAAPNYGWSFSRPAGPANVKLKAPNDASTLHGRSGAKYMKLRDGTFEVTEEDALPLVQRGWQRVV